MSVDHCEHVLADVYDWMQGGWEIKTKRARQQLAALDLQPATRGSRAIDVGAGTGYQSIPLAELGYSVISMDPSAAMSAGLRTHIGALAIEVTIAVMDSYDGPTVELICCETPSMPRTERATDPHVPRWHPSA